ncbi:hypothetical protein EQJ98_22825 [Salmonella enterica]|nr:hypothetical protein [Salmonella enterica]
MNRFLPFNNRGFMDFMSILGRCLLLPFPVAMFVDCLFPGIDDRFRGLKSNGTKSYASEVTV